MAVSAQAGTFSFGPKAGKGGTPPAWYRHRATMIDLSVIDETREGPPEVGGIAVPTFPYKSGPVVAGGATIMPRYMGSFGYLLLGLTGKVASAADVYNPDVYNHVFTLDDTDSTYVPWMDFRKAIPRKDGDANSDLGEIYKDCKIVGATLSLPNDMPLSLRLDAIGREFSEDLSPHLWSYSNSFEDWESIPVACQTGGYFDIGGQTLPVVAANVSWQNVPLDLRQERVFGDPFLEDVTIIQRRLAYDVTVKWNNPALYLQVLTGSPTGTEWGGKPMVASFEVNSVSSDEMPGEDEPYAMTISAEKVMMSQVGGITLAGNNAVMMRFTGVALDSSEYARITLRNKQTSYVWPS